MLDWTDTLQSFVTALGLGLMIGVVRERRHPVDQSKAGTRTHALVALLGCVCWGLGTAAFVAALLAVAALAIVGYRQSADKDPGLTGEVALLVTYVLAGLARQEPALAAGLAVVAAILLQAKNSLQRLSREWIRESELQDALLLAAAALVVMPVLPREALDPWGALHPVTLWRIVILVMAVGLLGHVALRIGGVRWGLPVAGLFAGFVSSTAVVAGFGRQAKEDPARSEAAAAAALLANLASLLLFAGVLGAASPALLQEVAYPLAAGVLALALMAALQLRHPAVRHDPRAAPALRPFTLSHALTVALVIGAVSLGAAWVRLATGDAGALVAAMLVALAEVHAAAASLGALAVSGGLDPALARWGVLAVLLSSVVSKTLLAFVSGGLRYGLRLGCGLLAMAVAVAAVTALAPR